LTYWMHQGLFIVPLGIFTFFNTNLTDVVHYEPV
jgi:hypothetical protein